MEELLGLVDACDTWHRPASQRWVCPLDTTKGVSCVPAWWFQPADNWHDHTQMEMHPLNVWMFECSAPLDNEYPSSSWAHSQELALPHIRHAISLHFESWATIIVVIYWWKYTSTLLTIIVGTLLLVLKTWNLRKPRISQKCSIKIVENGIMIM